MCPMGVYCLNPTVLKGRWILNRNITMLIIVWPSEQNILSHDHHFIVRTINKAAICMIVWLIGFNTNFNNISFILRQSVLLVEEAEYEERTIDLWQVTDKPYHVCRQFYKDLYCSKPALNKIKRSVNHRIFLNAVKKFQI